MILEYLAPVRKGCVVDGEGIDHLEVDWYKGKTDFMKDFCEGSEKKSFF